MSQPEISGVDPYQIPLKSIDQLLAVFHDSARAKKDVLIGIEYEMFGQIDDGKRPMPYEGPVSITALFDHLLQKSKNTDDPLTPLLEGKNMVGLSGKRTVIALEPGGQLEIAARPHHDLGTTTKIFQDLAEEINAACTKLGIKLFAVGIHPNARREDMAIVKKARYGIMRQHMQGIHGHNLGLDMMTRSCAIQINLDFENEKDMARKAKLGALLVPFYSLLCSSAAFIEGQPGKFALERGHVWRETDPVRTGIPALIFEPNFGYEAWINMVLDVPMYFIRRGEVYHDARNASFRDFMRVGIGEHRASVRDFIDHLSTVFTDIRFKPILELRSADSLPVPYVLALTALSHALFYDEEAHRNITNLFGDVTHKEIVALQNHAIDTGRQARLHNKPIFDWAEQIISIAEHALAQHHHQHLLAPLKNLVAKNITCAEWIRTKFNPLNAHNFSELVDTFAPLNNPKL